MNLKFLFSRKTYTKCKWYAVEHEKYYYETNVKSKRWNIVRKESFRGCPHIYELFVEDQKLYGFDYWPSKYWGSEPQEHLQRILEQMK